MDPATLSAAAIATLVITKAFEKTGEVIGEKVLDQGGKLMRLLREKFPRTASAIERVEQQPLDYKQALLVSKDVDAAANADPDVEKTVKAIADAIQPKAIEKFRHNIQQNVTQLGKFSTNIGEANNITIGDNIGENREKDKQ